MKKRHFFIMLFIIVAITDVWYIFGFFYDMISGFRLAIYLRDNEDYDTGEAGIKLLVNNYLCFWGTLVVWFIKIYYEMRWFFVHKLKRKGFLPYYRTSMTFNFANILNTILMTIIYIVIGNYFKDLSTEVTETLYSILQLIILEVYMRHLDSVHKAKAKRLQEFRRKQHESE